MSSLPHALLLGAFIAALLNACASGRVRGAQGTEMRQAEEYEPKKKVDPPEGNVSREPEAYPALEIDLERRHEPVGPALEPEPEPKSQPEPGNDPEQPQ